MCHTNINKYDKNNKRGKQGPTKALQNVVNVYNKLTRYVYAVFSDSLFHSVLIDQKMSRNDYKQLSESLPGTGPTTGFRSMSFDLFS